MRTKILILGLICLFMISCFTTPGQLNRARIAFVERHPFLLSEERDPELLSKIKEAILNGKIILGMNIMQVEASRGLPLKINTDTGEWGIHSQWIYAGITSQRRAHTSKKEWLLDQKYAYIYFENGVVTSWQSR